MMIIRKRQSGKCKVPCFVVLSYIDSGDDTAASFLDSEKRKDCRRWRKQNMFTKIFNHIQAGCFKHDVDVDDDGRSILSNTNSISIELLELQLTTNKNDLAESELVSAFIAIAIAMGIRFIEIQCLSNI